MEAGCAEEVREAGRGTDEERAEGIEDAYGEGAGAAEDAGELRAREGFSEVRGRESEATVGSHRSEEQRLSTYRPYS